jgi:hypothetical protein
MSMLRYNGFFKAMFMTRPEPRRMKSTIPSSLPHEPATWKRVLAFSLLYLSWGTTYFAIRAGVHGEKLPPALFGGVRVAQGAFAVVNIGNDGEIADMAGWRHSLASAFSG